jgi:hypothetical protein
VSTNSNAERPLEIEEVREPAGGEITLRYGVQYTW